MEFDQLSELYLPAAVLRQVDRDAVQLLGIPGILLMENAARGVCQVLLKEERPHTITIVCGRGNNGGDGLAIARLLAAEGVSSRCFLVEDEKPLAGDAAQNLAFLQKLGIPLIPAQSAMFASILRESTPTDWVIDSLLGTGLSGSVRSPYREIIDQMNQSKCSVLSVDIPSGMNSDDGSICGVCVRANRTVSFVCQKSGFLNPESAEWTGKVDLRPIGLPVSWIVDRFAEHNRK
ncbi:MAG: NAD(P)H-hydrate epimerase [Planctomyces sp.]|nr:NAD(P)H-hydrate epimerase [Planctomyces sp.]